MMTEPSFRSGTISDVKTLQNIQVRAGALFRQYGMADVADHPPTPTAVFSNAARQNLLLIAEANSQPIGFAILQPNDCDYHLEQMSIDPDYGQQGFGRQLLTKACDLATALGASQLTLSTFRHLSWNAPFYAKCGFAEVPAERLSQQLLQYQQDEKVAGLNMADRVMMARTLTSSRLQLRQPIKSELPEISDLCLRSKGYWGYDEVFLEACRDVLTVTEHDLKQDHLMAAVSGTAILGFAHVQMDDGEAVLDKLFVDPVVIGSGAGKRLFDWAVQTATAAGATIMLIDSDPGAESFYAKMGAVTMRRVASTAIEGRTLPQMEYTLTS